jgi:hypothetical protein
MRSQRKACVVMGGITAALLSTVAAGVAIFAFGMKK